MCVCVCVDVFSHKKQSPVQPIDFKVLTKTEIALMRCFFVFVYVFLVEINTLQKKIKVESDQTSTSLDPNTNLQGIQRMEEHVRIH